MPVVYDQWTCNDQHIHMHTARDTHMRMHAPLQLPRGHGTTRQSQKHMPGARPTLRSTPPTAPHRTETRLGGAALLPLALLPPLPPPSSCLPGPPVPLSPLDLRGSEYGAAAMAPLWPCGPLSSRRHPDRPSAGSAAWPALSFPPPLLGSAPHPPLPPPVVPSAVGAPRKVLLC